jgi:hypothetical protein
MLDRSTIFRLAITQMHAKSARLFTLPGAGKEARVEVSLRGSELKPAKDHLTVLVLNMA